MPEGCANDAAPRGVNGFRYLIDNPCGFSFPLISMSVLIRRGAEKRARASAISAGRRQRFLAERRGPASGGLQLFFALDQLPDVLERLVERPGRNMARSEERRVG